VSAKTHVGDVFGVTLSGTWSTDGSPVYLQATDSAGTFAAPPVAALSPKLSSWRVAMSLPKATPAGEYSGTFTVRGCADSECVQVYAGTTHTVDYTVTVNPVGEWETLQRTSRHDGYVPVSIDPTRYRQAWSWQRPTTGTLSNVVTYGDKIYFSEPGGTPSLRAMRAADGAPVWRRAFSGYGALNPPTVSDGVVYVTTTGHSDTWLYALRASDGLQAWQSAFSTQWAYILNPTVRNGRAYVNSGYYGGVVYAFNTSDGAGAWNVSGGNYGQNTPAVDDEYVYAHNGGTLGVYNIADGSLATSVGPSPYGIQSDYYGTVMLGSHDHAMAYYGTSYSGGGNRQLMDYSVAGSAIRWMSLSLYSIYPAVANGVVYAASNETRSFDALDEATGKPLWSWKPPETSATFMGNVVVTDNTAFVSTSTKIYAISLQYRRAVWSAPTPGMMSLAANRMLFVSTPADYYGYGRITAYRLN
jgi:outer membrane protein assembly factor BamB